MLRKQWDLDGNGDGVLPNKWWVEVFSILPTALPLFVLVLITPVEVSKGV